MGPVGTRTLTGTQARLPAAVGGACSLPWKLDGERESRSGANGCTAPAERGDASPGPAITAANSRPLFFESPSSRVAQPPQGEVRMGGLSGGKGLQKTTQISGVTHSFPRAGGPQLLAPTTPYLGRGKRTSSASLLLRGLGITPMKHRHPCLPPASGDSRSVEARRLTWGPQVSPAPNTFLPFLTSWQQGDPTLPAGSWALPQPVCSWASFLSACVSLCVVG